jgi:DnaK suppressor protein
VAAKKTTAKKAPAKKTPAKKAPAKKAPAKKTAVKAAPTAKSTKPAIKKPVTRPAPPAPPKKKVRAAKFTPDQLKKIRASLLEKKVELEARQKELDESSFDSTQSDITGEVGLDDDFADAGTATFERERDLSIRNNIRDLIDQVTRATARIDEGMYGTCERCGQPIDATRLRELPHASLCLDCKRREERAR